MIWSPNHVHVDMDHSLFWVWNDERHVCVFVCVMIVIAILGRNEITQTRFLSLAQSRAIWPAHIFRRSPVLSCKGSDHIEAHNKVQFYIFFSYVHTQHWYITYPMPRSFFAKGTQFMRVHKVVFECTEKNTVKGVKCECPQHPLSYIVEMNLWECQPPSHLASRLG